MGIPLLFGYLKRKYKSIDLIRYLSENEKCDNLFLDYNGLIHKVINNYTEKNIEKITDEEVYNDIYKYTKEIYNLVNPRKLLYIAIDGVAPKAKMNQQRMRRFKSGSRNPGVFDRNRVTPGTKFMKGLSVFLHDKFSNKEIKCKVIFSDVGVSGEGEHKIMKYLRDNEKFIKRDINIMSGLDADLIMLSMTVDLNIKLMRETEDYFTIFDINRFEKILIDDIQERIKNKLDKKRIIYDFVVMSFFLGNDFLPNLPMLKIKENGVNILLKTYTRMMNKGVLHIVNEDKYINVMNLEYFLNELGKSQMYIKKKSVEKYYKDTFKTSSNKYIQKVKDKYIEGVQWNTRYYFHGTEDYRWYYPYYHGVYAFEFKNIKLYNEKKSEEYTDLEQLVSVLPKNNLPNEYSDEIDMSIGYLFPDKFEIDNRDFNIPEHARNAFIPFINENDSKKLFEKTKVYKKSYYKNEDKEY